MTDNMELIHKISSVRENIQKLEKRKSDAENSYKQLCTKFGVKPAKNLEDLEDEGWLGENSKVLRVGRNPARENHEALNTLVEERELRQRRIQMMRQNI